MSAVVLHNTRVLVVEPDPAYAKLLKILLEAAGARVQVAATAEAALSAIPGFRPRLITVDLVLRGMTGLALIEAIKQDPRTRDTVVVAVSGLQGSGIEARVVTSGAAGMIRKPVSTETFADTLATVLGGKQP